MAQRPLRAATHHSKTYVKYTQGLHHMNLSLNCNSVDSLGDRNALSALILVILRLLVVGEIVVTFPVECLPGCARLHCHMPLLRQASLEIRGGTISLHTKRQHLLHDPLHTDT